MTANQISYVKLLEEQRANRASEANKRAELDLRAQELSESARRTNLQIESERRAQDLNVLNVQRQTEANIQSAGISAGASIYSADRSYQSNLNNIEAQAPLRASQVFANKVGAAASAVSTVLNSVGTLARIWIPALH